MARHVPTKVDAPRAVMARVGKQILEVVTAGMYNDPRMALREYIQNAADSIDAAIAGGAVGQAKAKIQIEIDGCARTITILDNGAGISNRQADRHLGSLGCSLKEGLAQRGFRGIGRLGGLAYCELLRFETRVSAKERVAVVEWDGRALKQAVGRERHDESLEEAVRRVASIKFRRSRPGDPVRFCRVQMLGVRPFHSDKLMDIRGVREYLSQAAPVPFDRGRFSFADEVTRYLSVVPGYNVYHVEVNGQQVFRPHADEVMLGEGRADRMTDVELFEWADGEQKMIGRGWYAKMQYLASLPRQTAMRGIRVRQGNIEIGHEYFLEAIYAERRFATWHVGEIHLLETVKPNARRDGFEESSEYERFLEQASRLGRTLSALCRASSKKRGALVSAARQLDEIERLLKYVVLVDVGHLDSHVLGVSTRLDELERHQNVLDNGMKRRLCKARASLAGLRARPTYMTDCLDLRRLKNLTNSEIFLQVCKAAFCEYQRAVSADDLLHRVVAPYLRPTVAALLKL
ncbi:MAG: ATP-binding protein [Phycisphaerae bacterium]